MIPAHDAGDPAHADHAPHDSSSHDSAPTAGFEHRHHAQSPSLPRPDADTDPATFWEALYQSSGQKWSGRPNAALVQNTAGLTPGTALDLGCGEGGDAVWLAREGWMVTAVDIAPSALARGAAAAEAAGVADRIRWVQADLSTWQPSDSFDLVCAHFLQSPVELPRDSILRHSARAVAPGGTFLVVGHAEFPPGHETSGEVLPTADSVLAALELAVGQWDVVTSGTAERSGQTPEGETVTFSDSVLRLRRVSATN